MAVTPVPLYMAPCLGSITLELVWLLDVSILVALLLLHAHRQRCEVGFALSLNRVHITRNGLLEDALNVYLGTVECFRGEKSPVFADNMVCFYALCPI